MVAALLRERVGERDAMGSEEDVRREKKKKMMMMKRNRKVWNEDQRWWKDARVTLDDAPRDWHTKMNRPPYDPLFVEDKKMGELSKRLGVIENSSTSTETRKEAEEANQPFAQNLVPPQETPLPYALQQLQDTLRTLIDQYKSNLTTYGRADQRIRKDWSWEVLKSILRVFPSPEAKALEVNASLYATAQREEGNISGDGDELRALEWDWKEYNGLLQRMMEWLSLDTTPLLRVRLRNSESEEAYDPSVLDISPLMACRVEEVRVLQVELAQLMESCRDLEKADWFRLGRIAEILGPTDPGLFGKVVRCWRLLKWAFLPKLWDLAYTEGEKVGWLDTLTEGDRVKVDWWVGRLREGFGEVVGKNPEVWGRRNEVRLLPLGKGGLRTDGRRHKMGEEWGQPWVAYVPWRRPRFGLGERLGRRLERRVCDVNRMLNRRLDTGGQSGMRMEDRERLERLLVPFMPAEMRRFYDAASAHGWSEKVREYAREAFEKMFETWLSSFEKFGVKVKGYRPRGKEGWLEDTLPATDGVENDTMGDKAKTPPYRFPILRQRDPRLLYRYGGGDLTIKELQHITRILYEVSTGMSAGDESAFQDSKDVVKLAHMELKSAIEGKDETMTGVEPDEKVMIEMIMRYIKGLMVRAGEDLADGEEDETPGAFYLAMPPAGVITTDEEEEAGVMTLGGKKFEIRKSRKETNKKIIRRPRGQFFFPFGETEYQRAYISWQISQDLKDIPQFNPKLKQTFLQKINPFRVLKSWRDRERGGDGRRWKDVYRLPELKGRKGEGAKSISVGELRRRVMAQARGERGRELGLWEGRERECGELYGWDGDEGRDGEDRRDEGGAGGEQGDWEWKFGDKGLGEGKGELEGLKGGDDDLRYEDLRYKGEGYDAGVYNGGWSGGGAYVDAGMNGKVEELDD